MSSRLDMRRGQGTAPSIGVWSSLKYWVCIGKSNGSVWDINGGLYVSREKLSFNGISFNHNWLREKVVY